MDRPRSRMAGSLTDHLVLQNLDLEMQLLKKKREMLERQMDDQHGRPRQFDQSSSSRSYDQQPFYVQPQQYERGRNYSGQQSKNFGNKNFGKRQPDTWQNDPSAKRVRRRGNFDQQYKPSNPNMSFSKQSLSFTSFKKNLPSGPPNKNFKPTKVTKPRTPPFNKLNSQPLPQRKALVAETVKLTKTIEPSRSTESMILQPDREPTIQMTGRLELALGAIVKEMKTEFSKADLSIQRVLTNPVSNRAIKKCIRERLRTIMLGRHIGNWVDIHKRYRNIFSIQSDADVLKMVSKNKTLNPIPLIFDIAEPLKNYVNRNFKKMLLFKMRDVFQELQTTLKNKTEEELWNSKVFSDVILNRKNSFEAEVNKILEDTNNDTEKTNNNGDNEDNQSSSEQDKTNSDQVITVTDEEIANNEKTSADEKIVGKESNSDLKIEGEDENKDESSASVGETADDTNVNVEIKKDIPNKPYSELTPREKVLKCNMIINKTFNETLPPLLNNYIEKIISMMEDLNDSNVIKTTLISKLEALWIDQSDQSVDSEAKTIPKKPLWKYCVKLWSKPFLPKREIMQAFLNQFNPVAIKRPKTGSKLLIIGLGNEENFKQILDASGTILEDKFTIFVSAAKSSTKQNASTSTTVNETNDEEVQIVENDEKVQVIEDNSDTFISEENDTKVQVINDNSDNDNFVTPELDTQITNLLDSIHKDEESEENADDAVVIDDDKDQQLNPEEEFVDDLKQQKVIVISDTTNSNDNTTEDVQLIEEEEDGPLDKTDESNQVIDEDDEISNKNVDDIKDEANNSAPVRSSPRRAAVAPRTIATRRVSKLAMDKN